MVNCAVFGCYNHSKKKPGDENASDVGFFSIPKVIVNQCKRTKDVTQRRRAEWLRRINRKDLDGSATHYRVCGKHSISGKFSEPMQHQRRWLLLYAVLKNVFATCLPAGDEHVRYVRDRCLRSSQLSTSAVKVATARLNSLVNYCRFHVKHFVFVPSTKRASN